MIDLVIFDMDGTLYGRKQLQMMYADLREKQKVFVSKVFSVSSQKADEMITEIVTRNKGYLGVALERDYGVSYADYADQTWSKLEPTYLEKDSELEAILNGLKPRKLALLTNAPQAWADKALHKMGLYSCFDGIWCDGPVRKPNPQAYLNVTNHFGIDPKKAMMVEDEPDNLNPAKEDKALGMVTVLVGNESRPYIDFLIADVKHLKYFFQKGTRF